MDTAARTYGRATVRIGARRIGYSIHQRYDNEQAKQPTQKPLRFNKSPLHPGIIVAQDHLWIFSGLGFQVRPRNEIFPADQSARSREGFTNMVIASRHVDVKIASRALTIQDPDRRPNDDRGRSI
jgi:hypothetical protein